MKDASKFAVGDTVYLARPFGWSNSVIIEWQVSRITSKGQVVCKSGEAELRLTSNNRIVGSDIWSRSRIVDAGEAAIIRAELAETKQWNAVLSHVLELEKAVRAKDRALFNDALAAIKAQVPA